ncbi:hypothetical protein [Blastococcus goldschmidtiae]|uniref:Uncharacterized protein n=1 Tax=Blastococcus goldschmidtiae TaxID=3075546 RepID=A0ABU2K670_9ACTN|nr:hypothetical protein [Blastococcus sp. DSM 46792]MDT0275696.1 hypothetical protein [Blastococcus sp. DSM 46792]
MQRPPDFWAGHSHLWDEWVRDHGLPELPRTPVAFGDSVPVAYWVGVRTAAVLHLYRSQDEGAPEPHTGTDLRLLAMVGDGWEYRGGLRSWSADELLVPPVPAREVRLDYQVCDWRAPDDDGCKALYGVVGVDAAIAEVEQLGELTRRTVEAPTGLFVVSVVADAPCTVRILDRDGEVLAEIEEPAGVEGVPRRA